MISPLGPRATCTDPVPDAVRRELDRVRDRWRALPADRAAQCAPAVAALVEELGARSASASGRGVQGPTSLAVAVLPDALAVVVHDCCVAGVASDVEARLTEVRRALP